MDAQEDRPIPPTPVALGILTAIVYVAGFAMVAAWFALVVLDSPRPSAESRAAPICRICGAVESVREVEPPPAQALEGSRAEGAIILLAALGGAATPAAGSVRIYQTSVLQDDGSVRIVRDSTAPQWKRGDRVKVIKGRIEPDSAAAATPALASAALAALPPGRTPSPAQRAARAP